MSRLSCYFLLVACFASVLANDTMNHTTRSEDDDDKPIAGFLPEKAPAFVALGLYGISALIHWINFFLILPRPRYMLSLTIGMTAMATGFVLRLQYIDKPLDVGSYVEMDLFILLSPCLFLATDYMLLSRLAASFDQKVTERCLLIRHSLIVKIFVWSDVATFLLQSTGGGLTAQKNHQLVSLGNKLTMIGLVLQTVSFLLFTVILVIFGSRVSKHFPEVWSPPDPRPFKIVSRQHIDDWRILYYVIFTTCVGILVRSVFRITEFAGGYNGTIAIHEVYFYLFDALPLWISMTLYCFVWPVRVFIERTEDHELNVRK